MRPALRYARTLSHCITEVSVSRLSTRLRPNLILPYQHGSPNLSTSRPARQHAASAIIESQPLTSHAPSAPSAARTLPRACPGCGGPAQVYDKTEAGYYDVDRKAVRDYLRWDPDRATEATKEDEVYAEALKNASPELLEELRVEEHGKGPQHDDHSPETPVCDRCHNLVQHRVGTPIHHPALETIQQTIAESPHRRNHIYHVLDAADFPLSLVPNLQVSLRIPKLRTQNRRAKHKGWVANDRIAEVSFIITRSDLLAPKKEQVDVLMPYFQEVLRDALGRQNVKARLGNVRLVSAKRGWWTRQIRDDIWDRGGAGWMVGKVNVGKSNLIEAVFPKGRGADYVDVPKIRTAAEREGMLSGAKSLDELNRVQQQLAEEDADMEHSRTKPQEHLHQPPEELEEWPEEDSFDDPDALLPQPQPFTLYPVLPIASSLPGTTASPIRIPFGSRRGELIDLPGLARTTPGLETFVQPSAHDTLVMKHRINSERYTLKPGQSLILGGGLVRITPTTEDLVFLLHPFVPIDAHITRTEKAIAYQSQTSDRQLQVQPILAAGVGAQMSSAGIFPLKWDVTKKLAGPVTDPVAGKMRPENLPYRIWATDILLEGVGWIEVSAQTRRPQGWKAPGMVKKDPHAARYARRAAMDEFRARQHAKFTAMANAEAQPSEPLDALSDAYTNEESERERHRQRHRWHDEVEEDYPAIEVFSPLGRFVGQRRPMCASVVSGPKRVAARERKARPRRSMVSVKRQRKPGGGGVD